MTTDNNLQFVRKKLDQTGMAVMYTTDDETFHLPNDVVGYLKMDDNGSIWLSAHRPRYWINNYEQHFPVRLLFYRKGVNFYIEVNGVAAVADEQKSSGGELNIGSDSILLKIVPSVIEYTENKKKDLIPRPMGWWSYFTNWLLGKMQLHTSRHNLSGLG